MMEKFDSNNCLTVTPVWVGGGRGSASSPHTSGSTLVNFDIILSPKSAFWMDFGISLSLQPKYFCTNSEQTNIDWLQKNWNLLNDVIFYINL